MHVNSQKQILKLRYKDMQNYPANKMETKVPSSGILHQKYMSLPLSIDQTRGITFTGSFKALPIIDIMQSYVSLREFVLCFLLLHCHLITLQLIFF